MALSKSDVLQAIDFMVSLAQEGTPATVPVSLARYQGKGGALKDDGFPQPKSVWHVLPNSANALYSSWFPSLSSVHQGSQTVLDWVESQVFRADLEVTLCVVMILDESGAWRSFGLKDFKANLDISDFSKSEMLPINIQRFECWSDDTPVLFVAGNFNRHAAWLKWASDLVVVAADSFARGTNLRKRFEAFWTKARINQHQHKFDAERLAMFFVHRHGSAPAFWLVVSRTVCDACLMAMDTVGEQASARFVTASYQAQRRPGGRYTQWPWDGRDDYRRISVLGVARGSFPWDRA